MLPMSFWDYVLLPIYLFILSIFISIYKNKYLKDSEELKLYFIWGFRFKMLCAIIYVLLTQYYFKGGDTIMYYDEGVEMNKYFINDITSLKYLFAPSQDYIDYKLSMGNDAHIGYIIGEGNFMPMRFVAFLSFFTFRNFTVITLFFSLFSFWGLWKLFTAFIKIYPAIKGKLAIAFLFFPSVIFWSSAILKDSICIGCIGVIVNSFFSILLGEKNKSNYIKILIFGILLSITKVYIAAALIPALALLLILHYKSRLKNSIFKIILIPFYCVFMAVVFFLSTPLIEKLIGDLTFEKVTTTIEKKQQNYAQQERSAQNLGNEDGGSYFSFEGITPTPIGLLAVSPKIINAVFFRPYVWESKNLIMLFSAFESFLLMLYALLVILRIGPFRFLKILFRDNILVFCFTFSIIFALIVGISTPNFGSLVRYKIPCVPFFCAMLLIINNKIPFKRKS